MKATPESSTVGLEDANRPGGADPVAVQEDHDLSDDLLLGPGVRDPLGSEARHRKDCDDPVARRHILRADRSNGRGSLWTADRSIDPARRRIARSAEGVDPD